MLAPLLLLQLARPVEAPAGLSEPFLELLTEIQRSPLPRAKRLATLLPKTNPILQWDESAIPPERREEFLRARDWAVMQWARVLPEFKPKFVAKAARPDVTFTFRPNLAREAGAAFFFGQDSQQPRLEVVLGLRRIGGRSSATDIHNEIAYALGAYIGLHPSVAFYGGMGRTDERAQVVTEPSQVEGVRGRSALVLASDVRRRLAAGEPLGTGTPALTLERTDVTLGEVEQGAKPDVTFSIANRGDAPLNLLINGDCACLTAVGPTRLGPGETGVIRARYNTAAIAGPISHTVLIQTNDPDQPLRRVPIRVNVRPVVTLIRPGGLTQVVTGDEPFEAFLVIQGDRKLPLDRASTRSDFPITATFSPWSGSIADPSMQEDAQKRSGFRYRAVPENIPYGRHIVLIEIPTDDPALGTLRFNFTLQRGVVAEPASAYFGDLGPGTEPIRLKLSQPGRPFRITSLRAANAAVTARMVGADKPSDQQTIEIKVDPRRVNGPLETTVTVVTSEPKQPPIVIPVLANLG